MYIIKYNIDTVFSYNKQPVSLTKINLSPPVAFCNFSQINVIGRS